MTWCGVCRNEKRIQLASWPKREETLKPGEINIHANATVKWYACPECASADFTFEDLTVYNYTSQHPKELVEYVGLDEIRREHMQGLADQMKDDKHIAFAEKPSDNPLFRQFNSMLFAMPYETYKRINGNRKLMHDSS